MKTRSGAAPWRVKQMVPVYPAAGHTWVEKLFKTAECRRVTTENWDPASQEEQTDRLQRLVEKTTKVERGLVKSVTN